MHQIVRDDVQLAQPFTTENGHGAGDQLPERRPHAADKQGNDADQHQDGAASPGHDGANLLQAWIADAQQLFDRLAGGLPG
ncbi:hypothetical protein D3C87_1207940 [compost metagenome]